MKKDIKNEYEWEKKYNDEIKNKPEFEEFIRQDERKKL
jgi:hypothetical protein